MKKHIPLAIPRLPRAIMLLLTALHFLGIVAIYIVTRRNGYIDEESWVHLTLLTLFFPISFTLMSIPAILQKFPGWVVEIYGENYLERLIFDAALAWNSVVERIK